ncbi:hypothetical protein ACHAXR_002125 [Thalassiosira sp. AJA248-18]
MRSSSFNSHLLESSPMDDDTLLQEGIDSLTSLNNRTHTSCAAKRPSLEEEDGTIVTATEMTVTEDCNHHSALDGAGEQFQQEEDDDDDSKISTCYNQGYGVPAEVKVSFHCENDNDDDSSSSSCHDSDCDSSELDVDESDEEEIDAEEESEEEEEDNDATTSDDDDESSSGEYETDEDIESEVSSDDDDSSSYCTAPSRSSSPTTISDDVQHELFLPWDVSPSFESLKYEEDDESSDEDDDDDDTAADVPHYLHRTYMIGNGRSGRPRMWDGCPSSISVSSNSSSSSSDDCRSQDSSSSSRSSSKRRKEKPSAKAGVSFSSSVTVYPVFETTVYSPSMVQSIYTKRDELRVNKLRNKKEYAWDCYDWRNATEEEEMERNDEGELVHPVHCAEQQQQQRPPVCRTRNVVQTYSSTLGGYHVGGVAHRAKRMRMYYP